MPSIFLASNPPTSNTPETSFHFPLQSLHPFATPIMSFGSPGGGTNFAKPIPPERGSFPLDHDNECKMHMASYLTCLKKAKGVNVDDCRMLSKAYLQCRMDKYVMSTGNRIVKQTWDWNCRPGRRGQIGGRQEGAEG